MAKEVCTQELVAAMDNWVSEKLWGHPQKCAPKVRSLGTLSTNSHPSLIGKSPGPGAPWPVQPASSSGQSKTPAENSPQAKTPGWASRCRQEATASASPANYASKSK